MNERSLSKMALLLAAAVALAGALSATARAQEKPAAKTVMAKILVTLQAEKDRNPPEVQKDDVIVRVSKERIKVKHWEAARGQYADLALFILIDDVLDPATSGLLPDVTDFIKAQPTTTLIGVAYMRNGTVQITQDLTNDHEKAVRALRLPLGGVGTSGSPYLSLTDMIKRWPSHGGRREILMVTDGIDRMDHAQSRMEAITPSPYVDSAISAAQRAGIPVYSIYAQGVGHASRNMWLANGGQNSISQLAEVTGAESYFLGYSNPVSFKPYLDDLQRMLNNQYWLAIDVPGGSKPALKPIKITTEVRGVEIISADSILIPAAK
jgi:hypothetical protein